MAQHNWLVLRPSPRSEGSPSPEGSPRAGNLHGKSCWNWSGTLGSKGNFHESPMMDGWLILQQSSGSSEEDKPIMKTKDERQKFQWKVQYSLGFPEKVSPPFRKKIGTFRGAPISVGLCSWRNGRCLSKLSKLESLADLQNSNRFDLECHHGSPQSPDSTWWLHRDPCCGGVLLGKERQWEWRRRQWPPQPAVWWNTTVKYYIPLYICLFEISKKLHIYQSSKTGITYRKSPATKIIQDELNHVFCLHI